MTPEETINRRLVRRILLDAPINLELGSKQFQSTLIDISLKGALFAQPLECQFIKGDSVKMEVILTPGGPSIKIQGEVIHISRSMVGMAFRRIGVESVGHLRRLVELNLDDQKLLERELDILLSGSGLSSM
ncbi:MAG: PilZ domain-containing protein [Sedimenticola sp.]